MISNNLNKMIGLFCFSILLVSSSNSQANALCIYEWETTSFYVDPVHRLNNFPELGASITSVAAVIEFDLPSGFIGEYSFATDNDLQIFPFHEARFYLTIFLTNGGSLSIGQGEYSYRLERNVPGEFSFWLYDYRWRTMFSDNSIFQDYGHDSGVQLEVFGYWHDVSPIPEPSSLYLLFSGFLGLTLHELKSRKH